MLIILCPIKPTINQYRYKPFILIYNNLNLNIVTNIYNKDNCEIAVIELWLK